MNILDLDSNTTTKTQSQADDPIYDPDEETRERIKNLAVVGKAIAQVENENNYQTDFLVAKQSLNHFEKLLDHLDLDVESRKGMQALIDYLQIKIERRLEADAAVK